MQDHPSRREIGPLAALGGAAALAAIAAPAAAQASARPVRVSPEDRFGILDLFAEYSWYYDCSDAEAYASLFTEDGAIEAFGSEAARGRENIATFIRTLFVQRGEQIWQHHTDHLLFFGGRGAYTVYSYWSLLKGSAQTQEYGVMGVGYYVSDCVKQSGRWLLKKRGIHRWNSARPPWAPAP
ncbi:MAG: nuclear transport factor 2 family protein [Hyphomonadaceae bacterium]|nr:nuclear transport factor 2 family protein [Hyphomonadaceae bacterium]